MASTYVPNTANFRLSDVVDVFPTADRLSQCFGQASDGYFYPSFKGVKDRLSNFRYYATKFGYLYNAFALTNLAAAGWRVPSHADYVTLITYIGGPTGTAASMRINNTIHWSALIGTNIYKFNAKAAGMRMYSSGYYLDTGNKTTAWYWTTDFLINSYMVLSTATDISAHTPLNTDIPKRNGFTVRLVKNTTTLTNGQRGNYTGNDGKVYPTICIGTQEWLADNLKETKFNTGAVITYINAANWGVDNTPARCAYWDYDNDTMV